MRTGVPFLNAERPGAQWNARETEHYDRFSGIRIP
jgi:hypothetical protein